MGNEISPRQSGKSEGLQSRHKDSSTRRSLFDFLEKKQLHSDKGASEVKAPLADVRVPPERQQIYEQNAQKAFGRFANERGISYSEYRQHLAQHSQNLLREAQPWMRVEPETLGKILNDPSGRFKSSFELLAKTPKYDQLGTLTIVENRLFSYPSNLSPDKRPIYGYASTHPEGAANANIDEYGKIAIRFQENVRERATVTFDDSIGYCNPTNQEIIPEPLEYTSGRSISTTIEHDPLSYKSLDEFKPWVELQYHGQLFVSEIKEVIFYTRRINDADIARLDALGIPYRYASGIQPDS